MRLIDKKNFLSILGISYMCVILGITALESLISGTLSHSHFNNLMAFVFCLISIGVLSQHYRFERFSPLIVIIVQYIVAIATAFLVVWLTSFIDPVSPGGYWDTFVSFSIPYAIGAMFYYINLRLEIKRQNENLKIIKALNSKFKN